LLRPDGCNVRALVTLSFLCSDLVLYRFGVIQAGNLFSFVPDVSSAKGAAEDMLRLVDSKPEIDAESTEGQIVEYATGHIELRDVHYSYRELEDGPRTLSRLSDLVFRVPAMRPGVRVLRGLSLTIKPGSYAAIVGASGSG
jgi:ATP-binding cassette subfamily B (MDR/TAP) protein 1